MSRRANRTLTVLVLLGSLCGSASAAVSGMSNTEILWAWLGAYNQGGPAALGNFQRDYLGNTDIGYAVDTREETGGFELVKVEADEPLKLAALLRERNSPSLWRVILLRKDAQAPLLQRIAYAPLPMAQSEALAALDKLATRLASADKFSGVILVARHDHDLYARAWGLADRSTKAKITRDTPFLVASQGKMFTAVAVLQLVATGKVRLDEPIGSYLTDYPNREVARKVTVRHLLAHQGGTGEMGLLEPHDAGNRASVHSIADIVALNGARGPAFEPGSKTEYSNYGYVLLGAIIEKVSGQSYYAYLKEHVFQPAAMLRTDFPLRGQMQGVASGYTQADDGTLHATTAQLPWRGTPAGGGVSTAADMRRFVGALKAGKLVPKALLAEATQNQGRGFGYGFISSQVDGFPYWGHGGGAPGNSLVLDYYPLTDTTFICMSNRDPPVCDRLAFDYLFRSPRQH